MAGPGFVERVRRIALALPETHEEVTWGDDLNFRVRKKIFCFPGDRQLCVKADPDELDALLADPRIALAPYVGRFGWITVDFSKGKVDWDEVRELVETSYRLIAPKKLSAQVLGDAASEAEDQTDVASSTRPRAGRARAAKAGRARVE